MDRKILLIPIIYMLISAASFVSDLYFFLNHDKHLQNLQSSNDAITLVHFLMVRRPCVHGYVAIDSTFTSVDLK